MKWKIKNGIVEDEKGIAICILTENATEYHTALIRNAVEMFNAIMDYSQSVENTKFPRNPKMHYDNFQRILINITDEAE